MKSVWTSLKEFCVETSSCPKDETNDSKFKLNAVREIVCREVGENVGKLYNSHCNRFNEQVFIFQCKCKTCQVKWRVKMRPSNPLVLSVELERNDMVHDHVVTTAGRLPRSVASYVSTHNELSSTFLLKQIKKTQHCTSLNDKQLKRKISHAKWYYTRKEKKRKAMKEDNSLERLKHYIESNFVNENEMKESNMKLILESQHNDEIGKVHFVVWIYVRIMKSNP